MFEYFVVRPVGIRFSPNAKLLAVGLENGELLLFTCHVEGEKVQLQQIQKFHDIHSRILSLEFSLCCNYIAISFWPFEDQEQEMQGSKVVIYKSKDSESLDYHYYKLCEVSQEKVSYSTETYLPNCACMLSFVNNQ